MTQGPSYAIWPLPDPDEGWTAVAKSPNHPYAGIGPTPQVALQNLIDNIALKKADEAIREEYAKRTHGSEDPATWARRWRRAKELHNGCSVGRWDALSLDEKTFWYERVIEEEKVTGSRCEGCRVDIDEPHKSDCPVWARMRQGTGVPLGPLQVIPEGAATYTLRDTEAHARIDTLQREVAYSLAQLAAGKGLAVDRYDEILSTFKRADRLALQNLRKHGVAYT